MKRYIALFIICSFMLTVSALLGHAEEVTVKATSAWQGKGEYFQVTDKQAIFVGAFSGIMFVETKQGALDAAKLVCPGLVEINLNNGTQSGGGRCIIEDRDGHRVYAQWACAGEHLQGCSGNFTLLGGTDKFKGITGKSAFEIRSNVGVIVADLTEGSLKASVAGLAAWPALTYQIP